MLGATLIVTPVDLRCPAACTYCYNADPLLPRIHGKSLMTPDILESLMSTFMQPGLAQYEIIWHGGEPTLAGIEFYELMLDTQSRYYVERGLSGRVVHHIQTSGLLLNSAWARFLKSRNFKVGISVDGPREIHNSSRKFPNGLGTFDRTMQGVASLREYGVKMGVGCVVTRNSLSDALSIFEFMRSNFNAFDFTPCFTTSTSDGGWTQSITAEQYAHFVIQLFDHWLQLDDPKIHIRSFRHYIEAALGRTPQICSMANGCHRYLSVDSLGNVYPCGRLHAVQSLSFGSILTNSFEEIAATSSYKEYQGFAHALSSDCINCRWAFACNNGCTAARYTESGAFLPKTPFCLANQQILDHVSAKVVMLQAA